MSFNKEDEEKKDSSQNEDDFGLPDLDYKPLDKLEQDVEQKDSSSVSSLAEEFSEEDMREEPTRQESSFQPEEETKSKAPVFIGLIIAVVVLAAAFLVWKYVIVPGNEKAKQEQIAKEKAKKAREEEARLAKLREEEERKRLADEAAKAKPAVGSIDVLTNPTKRYYVVITSAVDADLTMDYAKKLSATGVSSKIIPPFGKWKFNRLAIADFDSFQAAQTQADAAKATYGDAVWVIRY